MGCDLKHTPRISNLIFCRHSKVQTVSTEIVYQQSQMMTRMGSWTWWCHQVSRASQMITVVTVMPNQQHSRAPNIKVALVLVDIYPRILFSKNNNSGFHSPRRERGEGFVQSWIVHCLQAKCTEEILESHRPELD